MSCKLHMYSLQRTRLPLGPRLPKRIRNTLPHNYYDLKGKLYIFLWFFFKLTNYIVNWITTTRKSGKDLRKTYGCNLLDTFRLIGRAITVSSWFGAPSVRCELLAQLSSFGSAICGRWFGLLVVEITVYTVEET